MGTGRVYLETFGCQMNELDSELVSGALRALGYSFTDEPESADVVLYNTCSVRDHAEQKVRSRLGELRERKQAEPWLVVGVLGCMAERDGEDLLRRMPVVDVLCGPGELDKLPGLIENAVATRRSMLEADQPDAAVAPLRSARQVALQGNSSRRSQTLAAAQDTLELLDLSRSISASDHQGSAYVRITRGCNKFCSYCVVPSTRGAEMHRPPDHIVDECRRLAEAGVIEVTLLGQTVNHYRFEHGSSVTIGGVEQPQKGRVYAAGHRRDPYRGERTTTFADLIARIHDEVPGIARLRFVTSYPRDFGDDVLEVMRDRPRICRYLHVPAQTGSDRMLAAMNRGYTLAEYLEFIDRARSFLDEPAKGRPLMIAGDIIAGFCGETEEDHQATIALLERVRYKNCFIFRYSPRPGTTAFDRQPDDVPEAVKRRRVNELLDVQARISEQVARTQVSRTIDVFVQGLSVKQQKSQRGQVEAAANQAPRTQSLTISARPVRVGAAAERRIDAVGADAAASAPAGDIQLSGRSEGDLIVVFDCPPGVSPESLIGTVVPVRIEAANRLTLTGVLERAQSPA